MWHYGFLFAPALTVGGGTGEVQRNIVAERVLGLPHDVDVEQGQTWAEARRAGVELVSGGGSAARAGCCGGPGR